MTDWCYFFFLDGLSDDVSTNSSTHVVMLFSSPLILKTRSGHQDHRFYQKTHQCLLITQTTPVLYPPEKDLSLSNILPQQELHHVIVKRRLLIPAS